MIELLEDRARIRNDLEAILESVELEPAGVGTHRVHGQMRFGASLVGPKDRLHGGLHAYARTLAILSAIDVHDHARTYPVRLELGLYRPLPLETSVSFEGRYRSDESGFELVVDHAEREKLRAFARPANGATSRLEWFADAYARTRGETPIHTIKAQGDVPMAVHGDIIVVPIDRAMRTGGAPTFARFVAEDGTLDAAAICVVLDLLGAVTQGYAWQSRIFTTRIDLVLAAASIPGDVDVVALADRNATPDPECHVRPAEIRNGMAGPTKVRVLLADSEFERAYAYGTFTLVPAPGELHRR